MSGPVTFELPNNLTIATAESLHEQLEPLLTTGDDVVLNAAEVKRADTAGLQLLLAFQKALISRSVNMSWSAPSQPLLEAAEQLGLKQMLALE